MTMKAWYKDELEVTVIEKNGGWTTVEFKDGMQRKVRNGDLREILDEKVEYTLDEALAEEAQMGKIRKCVNTTYNPGHYTKAKSINGHATLHNGDAVAQQLAAMDLDGVYNHVAFMLDENINVLKVKYMHLNPGMVRMNLGNRLRAYYRKNGKVTEFKV
jgi:hypothetical protein